MNFSFKNSNEPNYIYLYNKAKLRFWYVIN